MENPKLVGFEIHKSDFKSDFCNPNFKQGVIPESQFFPCNLIIPNWGPSIRIDRIDGILQHILYQIKEYLIDLCTIPVDVEWPIE